MSRKFLTGIDLNSQKITSVADPTSAADGANKQYVDNRLNGLDWHTHVRAASSSNISIASAPSTVDGVTLASGDRVLLFGQTTASQNGLWVFAAAASPFTRPTDYTGSIAAKSATTVLVTEGGTFADKAYTLSTDTAITVDTTATTWVQVGGGTTYTAGNGLTGATTFSVLANGTSINVSASGIKIDATAAGAGLAEASGILSVNVGTGIEISADTLRLAAAAGTGLTGGAGSALAVDTSVVARYLEVSSAAAQTTVVTHNFGRAGVQVQVYDPTGFNVVEADVTNRTTNACTVDFGAAVTAGQYKIVVVG